MKRLLFFTLLLASYFLHTGVALSQMTYTMKQSASFDSLYADRLQWPSMSSEHFRVHFSHVDSSYPRAIIPILETCYRVYEESLGVDMPDSIVMFVGKEQNKKNRLFQNSHNRIVWEFGSDSALASPLNGGPPTVFGMCHEMGHMVLGFYDHNFSEAWANYLSAYVALPAVDSELGKDIWPDPYDYLRLDGAERIDQAIREDPTDLQFYALRRFQELGTRDNLNTIRRVVKEFRPDFVKNGPLNLHTMRERLAAGTKDTLFVQLLDGYLSYKREHLYPEAREDTVRPVWYAQSDSTMEPEERKPGFTARGKTVVFFLPNDIEFDSLKAKEGLSVSDIWLEFITIWGDVENILKGTDISVLLTNSPTITGVMNNGARVEYQRNKFTRFIGIVLADGVQMPKVYSGLDTTEGSVSKIREYFGWKE